MEAKPKDKVYTNREFIEASLDGTGTNVDTILNKCSGNVKDEFEKYLEGECKGNPGVFRLIEKLVPDKKRFLSNLILINNTALFVKGLRGIQRQ